MGMSLGLQLMVKQRMCLKCIGLVGISPGELAQALCVPGLHEGNVLSHNRFRSMIRLG
jgi:hypothetical protein